VSDLAPILQSFFTDRLITQKHASQHTIRSYRDTFRLLLTFTQQTLGTPPWRLDVEQLDAEVITSFLRWLEADRGNSPRTRNARLSAIRSLFRYASLRAPDNSATIQRVLAIQASRADTTVVGWLTDTESDALLAVPDRNTWIGCRDYALLLTALRTGLRVSELTQLRRGDLHLGAGAHVRCTGKGRKERCTPIDAPTIAALRDWLTEHPGPGHTDDPLFTTRQGTPLSRDAVHARITNYQETAARSCPSLADKHLTPHTLRHSTAMHLRHAGVDNAVIALWLGHQDIRSTQVYTHADLKLKEQALARTTPPDVPPGRFKPSDQLLAFLEAL
jgi:integrase/recombinase XerD